MMNSSDSSSSSTPAESLILYTIIYHISEHRLYKEHMSNVYVNLMKGGVMENFGFNMETFCLLQIFSGGFVQPGFDVGYNSVAR